MAKRYKQKSDSNSKRKQVFLASVTMVMVTAVIIGMLVKANSYFKDKQIFNNENITISSSEEISSESSIVTSSVPLSEFLSSIFSSDAVEVFNPSSGKTSSSKPFSSVKPTATPKKPTQIPTKSPFAPTPTPTPTQTPTPTPEIIQNLTIMGTNKISVEQMVTFLMKQNQIPKINPPNAPQFSIYNFVKLFLDEGSKEGVRGDIAFCQSIIETGWFTFLNDVKYEQCNYSGMGATGGVSGNSYQWQQKGVRAQILHLKLLGSNDRSADYSDDPRYWSVLQNIAPKWADLGGTCSISVSPYTVTVTKWASDTNYGQKILSKYTDLKNTSVDETLVYKSKQ